jgi:serine/threonine protein kinase
MYIFHSYVYGFVLDTYFSLLGSGSYGRVYCVSKDGKNYALKTINFGTEKEQELAFSEERSCQLLKDLSPYLVNLVESFVEVSFFYLLLMFFLKEDVMYLVMEYCENGNLNNLINCVKQLNLSISEDVCFNHFSVPLFFCTFF